jgi:hypothetical protein
MSYIVLYPGNPVYRTKEEAQVAASKNINSYQRIYISEILEVLEKDAPPVKISPFNEKTHLKDSGSSLYKVTG